MTKWEKLLLLRAHVTDKPLLFCFLPEGECSHIDSEYITILDHAVDPEADIFHSAVDHIFDGRIADLHIGSKDIVWYSCNPRGYRVLSLYTQLVGTEQIYNTLLDLYRELFQTIPYHSREYLCQGV